MKTILHVLIIAGLCFGTSLLAADEDGGGGKPVKESYSVVKLTKLDKSATVQVITRPELLEMQKKFKYESMVMGQAFKAAAAEWSKGEDGKKGPPFPLTTMPPARTVKVLGTFSDNEKATALMEKEIKKCDEAQAKLDKAAAAKRDKVPKAKRDKYAEKEMEIVDALGKLQSKIEELAWAKETEASAAPGAKE